MNSSAKKVFEYLLNLRHTITCVNNSLFVFSSAVFLEIGLESNPRFEKRLLTLAKKALIISSVNNIR